MPYSIKTETRTFSGSEYTMDNVVYTPNENTKLCVWSASFGRMGSLGGAFFAEPETVNALFGEDVYLGECLGKHSDISYSIVISDFTFYDVSEQTIIDLMPAVEKDSFTLSGENVLFRYMANLMEESLDENEEYINELKAKGIIVA